MIAFLQYSQSSSQKNKDKFDKKSVIHWDIKDTKYSAYELTPYRQSSFVIFYYTEPLLSSLHDNSLLYKMNKILLIVSAKFLTLFNFINFLSANLGKIIGDGGKR